MLIPKRSCATFRARAASYRCTSAANGRLAARRRHARTPQSGKRRIDRGSCRRRRSTTPNAPLPPRASAFDDGPWGQIERGRPRGATLQSRRSRSTRRATSSRASTRSTTANRCAKPNTTPSTQQTAFATTPASPPNRKAKPSTSRRRRKRFTVREPIGVCGQIVPWNYPLLMAVWKLAPALAAGNVCILKPSELTPLSVIRFASLFERTRVPAGRRQHRARTGQPSGHALPRAATSIRSPSPAVPRRDAASCIDATGNLKKDLARARRQIAEHRFRRRRLRYGGRLRALRHLLRTRASLLGRFAPDLGALAARRSLLERLVERAKKIRVGDGFDPQTEMGPIISPVHRNGRRLHRSRQDEGAKLLCGGNRFGGALAERQLSRADDLRRHDAADAHRAGRDLRSGARRANVRRRSRGDSRSPTTRCTA